MPAESALLKAILWCVALCCCAANAQQCKTSYTKTQGYLCIRKEFIQTPFGTSQSSDDVQCSVMCSKNARCQAFSTADGWCQLFVFDSCSKNVRDCNCTRTGRVFVKQQLGLPRGKLCPSGYNDSSCGVRYRMYLNSGSWGLGRQMCENESGLVIMADVMDAAEMSFINAKYDSMFTNSKSLWLGGFQTPIVAKSKSGWYWVGCNLTVDASLWVAPEPDNYFNDPSNMEITIGRYYARVGLADFQENGVTYKPAGVLCECVSPFD